MPRFFVFLVITAAAAAALGLAFGLWWGRTNPPQPDLARPVVAPSKAQRQLATTHCGSCHQTPEPTDLPATHWPPLLEEMALFLGLEEARLPNSKRMLAARRAKLEQLGLWPREPLCTPEEFRQLVDYYVRYAPAELCASGVGSNPPPPDSVSAEPAWPEAEFGTRSELPAFRPAAWSYVRPAALTTLVHVDAERQQIWIGDSKYNDMTVLDDRGQRLRRFPLDGPPTAMQWEGDDLFVTTIGILPPDDRRLGRLLLLENAHERAQPRVILDGLPRTPHSTVVDLDGDGDRDLVVASFGNLVGRLHWYENNGQDHFQEHVWIDQPGCLKTAVHDVDGDGRLDVLALLAQQNEALVLFRQTAPAQFEPRDLWTMHAGAGLTDFQLVDFDGDGDEDVLLVNGDNGDLNKGGGAPPLRPYHGLHLLENQGPGTDDGKADVSSQFTRRFFLPLHGATRAVAADFDADGDTDLAAVAHYPDFLARPLEGFILFENRGSAGFVRSTTPTTESGRWMTLDAGDVDGDGDLDLVLGAAYTGIRAVGVEQWEILHRSSDQPALLLLENELRTAE